jgi:FkbM family methyltransferase
MIMPLDVKIANFFRRVFSYYVRKRMPIKPIVDSELEKTENWLKNFHNEDYFEHILAENIKIILYKDSRLCKLIYGSFEETEICFLKKFLRKGDCFFDIGANIGLFSLHASNIVGENGKIFAFEPTPVTFDRLMKNIDINNFSNINAENIGLSNAIGVINFNVSNDGFDAWNSFATLVDAGECTEIKVLTNTLDNYISSCETEKIDLIKLDVEGWELNVLKGATRLLSTSNSPVMLVEFTETNAFAAGYYCGELFDFVKSFGYEWYAYNAESNELIIQQKKLHYPYENLIAIKNLSACNERLTI